MLANAKSVFISLFFSLVFTALATTAAQAECKIELKAKLSVEIDNGQILVPIRINGVDVKLALNTSLQTTTLFESALPELGLRDHNSVSLEWKGPHGDDQAMVADVKEIVLGGATWRNVSLLTVRGKSEQPEIVGEMGSDILGMYDIDFDLNNNTIRLLSMNGCTDAESVFWGGSSFAEADIDERPGRLTRYYTTLVVNGRPFKAELDTGSRRTVIDAGMAQLAGITLGDLIDEATPPAPSFPAQWPSSAYARFNTVAVGEEQIKNAVLLITRQDNYGHMRGTGTRLGPYLAGDRVADIGMDFFQSHRVLVSNSHHKIFFTYSGGPIFPAPAVVEKANQKTAANTPR